jgi:hypothetical protein
MEIKGGKMPNGMILTVLAGNKYTPHLRDDIAFYETIRKVYNKISLIGQIISKNLSNHIII